MNLNITPKNQMTDGELIRGLCQIIQKLSIRIEDKDIEIRRLQRNIEDRDNAIKRMRSNDIRSELRAF